MIGTIFTALVLAAFAVFTPAFAVFTPNPAFGRGKGKR